MSHASVMVALSPEDIKAAGGLDEAITHQMAPFDENGEWFKDGSRWDWWVVGGRFSGRFCGENVTTRGEFDEAKYTASQRARMAKAWEEWEKEPKRDDPFVRGYLYGIQDGETKEQYVARRGGKPLSAAAFLKNREWHEGGRMGWFGATTATECERKADAQGEVYEGRCLHTDEKTGAKIVTWSGPKDDDEKWGQLFFARFVRNLPADYTLVMVDYHV